MPSLFVDINDSKMLWDKTSNRPSVLPPQLLL